MSLHRVRMVIHSMKVVRPAAHVVTMPLWKSRCRVRLSCSGPVQ